LSCDWAALHSSYRTKRGRVDIWNVIVSWKDTREARKAILDALLLLKREEYVTVCELVPGDDLDAARTYLVYVVAPLKLNHVLAELLLYALAVC